MESKNHTNPHNSNTNNQNHNNDDDNNDESALMMVPKKLELTLNPEDGSLQTVSLYQVLLAVTDALHTDLYNMAQGEIDIVTTTTAAAAAAAGKGTKTANGDEEDTSMDLQQKQSSTNNSNNNNNSNSNNHTGNVPLSLAQIQHKKERMTNLSFAQRRHEVVWRMTQNMKCIQQVAALTSAAACTDFGNIIQLCTKTLQHTHTAWIQADEAQDAMYFFHAQLFPARVAPYDIYGAMDVLLHGKWYDLPNDMLLYVDRYMNSIESTWSKQETDQRWQITVREKLVMGEVGYIRRQQLLFNNNNSNNNKTTIQQPVPRPLWNITLTGGIVKLTAGRPKYVSTLSGSNSGDSGSSSETSTTTTTTTMKYPIEALLTVFPSQYNIWTLLSVQVNVHAKTGDFHHQLQMSDRQRYDLHRIAATAMRREEIRNNQLRAAAELSHLGSATIPTNMTINIDDNDNDETNTGTDGNDMDLEETTTKATTFPPSRPLQALFHVTHMFLMAWQLELLSAQAMALRRGVWGATMNHSGSTTTALSVTPVRFFDNSDGYMSISFWKVDDAYGPPSMGDLNSNTIHSDNIESATATTKADSTVNHNESITSTGQLTLKIRAESSSGIIVSLSGGTDITNAAGNQRPMIQSTINELIEAATNPMALSASDALLAATKLCAEFKCLAVVDALQPKTKKDTILPPWVQIRVRRGCIDVAVHLRYHNSRMDDSTPSRKVVLFQMICDARTGSFVITIPQSMKLLRQLVCDDIHASAPVALRIISVPLNRRRAAGSNSTGRIVREAFDSLVRSMNLLGQRVGVGDLWDDIDDKSYMLRQRAVHLACIDVKSALMSCCGLAALYGLVPLALGTAVGLDAVTDIAGPPIDTLDGHIFIKSPPVSIMLSQDMVETIIHKSEGVGTKKHHLDQDLLSFVCSANDSSLCIYPLSINVKLESPSAFVERISVSLMSFKELSGEGEFINGEIDGQPSKRLKQTPNVSTDDNEQEIEDVILEVERLSELITEIIED